MHRAPPAGRAGLESRVTERSTMHSFLYVSAAGGRGVKIGCHCGASIIDQTDDLPHKGHLIPDQEWFATYDAIDDEVIDPVAGGQLGTEAAYHRARDIIGRSARLMWQCR